MISANLIEKLFNSGFSATAIERIIALDYTTEEEKLQSELQSALHFLKTREHIRKINS